MSEHVGGVNRNVALKSRCEVYKRWCPTGWEGLIEDTIQLHCGKCRSLCFVVFDPYILKVRISYFSYYNGN